MAGGTRRWALVALLRCLFLGAVSPLYFHLRDGQQQCFIRDISADVVVIGDHHSRLLREEDEPSTCLNSSLFIEAKDPDDEVVHLGFLSERSFTFTSVKPGAHRICLLFSCPQRPLSAGRLLEVHLDFRSNQWTPGSDRLPRLRQKVRSLTRKAALIQKELHDHRLRHEDFQRLSHNTDMWVFWWPVVRSLYVVAFIMGVTGSW